MSMQLARAKCGCSEEVHNTPYIPQGSSCLPYLDVSTLSRGVSCTQFCTGLAMFMQIALLLWHWGGLASRRGRGGVESVSPFLRGSMANLRRGALPIWSNFIVSPFIGPSSLSRRGHPDGGRNGFKLLQDANQARAKLECELVQETQELASQYDNKQIKQARRHERWQAQMVKQTDATFQEVFSQVSLANSVKILPWCFSSTVPLHYMSRALTNAMQQVEVVPATTTASEPEGSLAPGPSSSSTQPPETPPLPVPPLPDIPFVGTPPVRCQFAEFLVIPTQKKQDHSPSGSLINHHNKRTCVNSPEVEARSEHSSAQGDEDTPKLLPSWAQL